MIHVAHAAHVFLPPSAQRWRVQRTFFRPALVYSPVKRSSICASQNQRLSKNHMFAFKNDHTIASLVSVLLFVCGPLAVAGFVIAVVVYAFECHAERLLAHVGQKVAEVSPAFADRDTASTIIFPLRLIAIKATPEYSLPRNIGPAFRAFASVPVTPVKLCRVLNVPAPASFGAPATDIRFAHNLLFAAFTLAEDAVAAIPGGTDISWRSRSNHSQPCKLGTGRDRFSGRHNVEFRSIFCSVAGDWLQPVPAANSDKEPQPSKQI